MSTEELQSPLLLETTLLKNFLQELKPSILKNGGRNFSEWGSGRGDGAGYAELKFIYAEDTWEIRVSTEKRRVQEIQTKIKRRWLKKVETKTLAITLEVNFSLSAKSGPIPSEIISAIREKNSAIKREREGISWIYLLHTEQELEQTQSQKERNGIIVQELFQKEKTNMLKNAKEVLETIFSITEVEEENRLAAAK